MKEKSINLKETSKLYIAAQDAFKNNIYDQASKNLREVIKLDYTYIKAYSALAKTETQYTEQYSKIVELLAAPSSTISQLIQISSLLYSSNHMEAAQKVFDDCLPLEPTPTEYFNIYYGRGAIAEKLGKKEEAADNFKKAIDIKLPETVSSEFFTACKNIGDTLIQLNDKQLEQLALHAYTKAMSINPLDWETHSKMAIILINYNIYEKAKIFFESAVVLNPQYSDGFYHLGLIFSKFQEYDKAIKNYEITVKLDPNYYSAYFNMANYYSKLDGVDNKLKAINYYKQAIKANSEHFPSYFNLASKLINTDEKEAIEIFKNALHIEPKPQYHQEYYAIAQVLKCMGLQKEAALACVHAMNTHPGESQSLIELSEEIAALQLSGDSYHGGENHNL